MINWQHKVTAVFGIISFRYCFCSPIPTTSRFLGVQRASQVATSCISSYILLGQNRKISKASADVGVKQSVADVAQYIPGFGESNVYYPRKWLGFWHVRKNITEVTILSPSLSQVPILRQYLTEGNPIEYDQHYVTFDDKVVLDRSYSLTSYYRILFNNNNIITKWTPSDPNVIFLSDGAGLVGLYTNNTIYYRSSLMKIFLFIYNVLRIDFRQPTL